MFLNLFNETKESVSKIALYNSVIRPMSSFPPRSLMNWIKAIWKILDQSMQWSSVITHHITLLSNEMDITCFRQLVTRTIGSNNQSSIEFCLIICFVCLQNSSRFQSSPSLNFNWKTQSISYLNENAMQMLVESSNQLRLNGVLCLSKMLGICGYHYHRRQFCHRVCQKLEIHEKSAIIN